MQSYTHLLNRVGKRRSKKVSQSRRRSDPSLLKDLSVIVKSSGRFVSTSATDRPVLGLGVGGEVAGEAAHLTVQ